MEVEIKPLTHLVKPSKFGNRKGKCIFCYQYTEHGFSLSEIPNTFTDWDKTLLSEYNVVCEYCYNFLKDERFRRKSWIIFNNEIHFLSSRKEILKFIENPPTPPYAIYVIKQGKKHGWLNMMFKGVNYSRDIITIGFEDEIITINREQFLQLIQFLKRLRRKGLKKDEIRNPTPKTLMKITFEEYEKLRQVIGRNDFELALTIID